MSTKPVTIRDIAKRLGLSPATVSTALTGQRNGVFVSEETRQRVWETAQAMGYPLERLRVRAPKLRRVALFCPPRHDSLFISGTVLELSHLLNQQGFQVLVHISQDREQACYVAQELYRRRETDGVIFVGSRHRPDELAVGDVPCVVVGEVPEGVAVWRVGVDNEGGGRLVGEHLWTLGHRKVGMVFCEANPLPSAKRLKGLKTVWQEHGKEFPDRWVLRVYSESESELMEKLPAFVRSGQRLAFTALFCYNDRLAGIAMKCLRRMGVRVPEDVSVVGFDDVPYAELLDPPLTTVEQPFAQLGALAAQLLQERLAANHQPPKALILPCRLVVRASTAAVA